MQFKNKMVKKGRITKENMQVKLRVEMDQMINQREMEQDMLI